MKNNNKAAARHRCSSLSRIAALVAVLASGAACETPVDVDDRAASIRVSSDVQAYTLGDLLHIDAEVRSASGRVIPNADIRWELSHTGVLEQVGEGQFRVAREGTVDVAAVLRRDPSVRALVAVKVDASFLARACIVRADQAATGSGRGCAEQRMTVHMSPLQAAASMSATTGTTDAKRSNENPERPSTPGSGAAK